MARRPTGHIDDHRLQVLIGADDSAPTELEDDEDQPEEIRGPDDYSVRVTWQSEEEKLEAAEFMLATRAQQEARLRTMHEIDQRRDDADD